MYRQNFISLHYRNSFFFSRIGNLELVTCKVSIIILVNMQDDNYAKEREKEKEMLFNRTIE